jgi:hypothetical protein
MTTPETTDDDGRCDYCIGCGWQFPSAEVADLHNWYCDDCRDSGGIRGVEDPSDPTLLLTPVGVLVHLVDAPATDDPATDVFF